MPKNRLKDPVFIWTDRDDDASCFAVTDVEALKEDYLFDGDEATAPRSVMKEIIDNEKKEGTYQEGDFHLVHPKGRRILYAEQA
jgi:hypothetical protein